MQSETTVLPRNSSHVAFATHTGLERSSGKIYFIPTSSIFTFVHPS